MSFNKVIAYKSVNEIEAFIKELSNNDYLLIFRKTVRGDIVNITFIVFNERYSIEYRLIDNDRIDVIEYAKR